jgi:hypothetical protein
MHVPIAGVVLVTAMVLPGVLSDAKDGMDIKSLFNIRTHIKDFFQFF